jgi:hypothetical protein
MIGLPKSSSFMPVARQRPRAPAMFLPCVVVRERYCGIVQNSRGRPGKDIWCYAPRGDRSSPAEKALVTPLMVDGTGQVAFVFE